MSIEERIKSIKSRREALLSKKAEKVARHKSAQEDLKALKEDVEAKGFKLKDIPNLLETKKQELASKVASLEEALEEAEEQLAKYD